MKLKRKTSVNKKQYLNYIISFGISIVILIIAFAAIMIFGDRTKIALAEVKKGDAYFEQGKYSLAEQAYRNAVNNNSKDENARLKLAETLVKLDKGDSAVKLMTDSINLNPGDENYYIFIIKYYVSSNQISKALEFINNINHPPVLMKIKDERPAGIKFTPNPGSYDKFISVAMASDNDSTIYYTQDGSQPDLNSAKYTTPVKIEVARMNIRAIAVDSKNMISDEASVIFNIYNDSQPYQFADSKIEAIVRSQLKKPNDTIMYSDIIKITRLSNFDADGKPIDGLIKKLDDLLAMKSLSELVLNNEPVLTGFSVFSSLNSLKSVTLNGCEIDDSDFRDICAANWIISLKLDKNQITDLTQLTQLSSLQIFTASENKISSVEAFGVLTGIKQLDLSKNSIVIIDTLSRLTALTTLNLSSNKINNINPILSLNNLTDLKLSNNQINNISGISVLKNLKKLNLSENSITDISPLANFSSLYYLDLSKNNLSDLSALSKLTLNQLELENCNITDLSPLSGIATLTYLDLRNTTTQKNVCPYVNDITDLTPLSSLQNLDVVFLNLNINLVNLRPLQSCSSLKTVYCNECPRVDKTTLSGTNIDVSTN